MTQITNIINTAGEWLLKQQDQKSGGWADRPGGWIGGLLGGVVLLPVLGLVKTCTAVVLLKMTSLLILLVSALLNKGRA